MPLAICDMKESLGITFIVISHDIVGTINGRPYAMLYGGQLIEWGPTARLSK